MYFEPPSDARVTLYVVIHAETSFQAVCIREDEANTSRTNEATRPVWIYIAVMASAPDYVFMRDYLDNNRIRMNAISTPFYFNIHFLDT
ncbi:unnamed protein product [Clonostachys rosea f. rosea IK726]|uniref:Uncharacterized protein n=1 Tax=Clonostachys rosea f. rosea IK726 TaxID=1349383 RepID=A0ACA9TAT2_BIOOC|nr:unnamed protein product [Clonostachys rosea f. rosea IK726]